MLRRLRSSIVNFVNILLLFKFFQVFVLIEYIVNNFVNNIPCGSCTLLKMLCMCQYDSRVAGGEGSRVEIDLEKLKAAGWNVEKSGKSYIMESPPPAKKRFRSTKEVAEFLKSEDDFFAFSQCSCGASAAPTQESSESDEDTDYSYRPDTEEEGGMSSNFEDTPRKVDSSTAIPAAENVVKR